jgi:hypothetical protein
MIHRTNCTSMVGASAATTSRSLNVYPQPSEIQKAKLREYDQFKESQRAAKGKGGYGRDTQMGRPPATYAHGAPSTEHEQQDMLDQGLEMLQQMRTNFGME